MIDVDGARLSAALRSIVGHKYCLRMAANVYRNVSGSVGGNNLKAHRICELERMMLLGLLEALGPGENRT